MIHALPAEVVAYPWPSVQQASMMLVVRMTVRPWSVKA